MDKSRSGVEETDVSITPPKAWAVGVPAGANPLRYSLEQTTVRRTALTLLNLNQSKDFDCPGCACRNRTPLTGTGHQPVQEGRPRCVRVLAQEHQLRGLVEHPRPGQGR
jgi:hypothetical protein